MYILSTNCVSKVSRHLRKIKGLETFSLFFPLVCFHMNCLFFLRRKNALNSFQNEFSVIYSALLAGGWNTVQEIWQQSTWQQRKKHLNTFIMIWEKPDISSFSTLFCLFNERIARFYAHLAHPVYIWSSCFASLCVCNVNKEQIL